jgi:hypothetical protein
MGEIGEKRPLPIHSSTHLLIHPSTLFPITKSSIAFPGKVQGVRDGPQTYLQHQQG